MNTLIKLSVLSLGFTIAGAASAADLCSVTYEATNTWGNGGQQAVTVTNNGPALDGWEFGWTFNGNETVQQLWNGSVSQSGADVTVTDAGYNGSVATGGTFNFGFIVNDLSGNPPTEFYLNGQSCSEQIGNENDPSAVAWQVDGVNSVFNFVTVKKEHTAEIQTFTQFQGTIDDNGLATFAIDLDSVETNIDIRNERLRNILFETDLLPTLYYNVQLDLADIDSMAIGTSAVQTLDGSLTLHGVTTAVAAQVLVVKTSDSDVSVSTARPILVNGGDFDLGGGIEALRTVASLSSIGETVPVYFRIDLNANNDPSLQPVAVPAAPTAPATLTGDFDAETGIATLSWTDSSDNETAFIIRRQITDGFWETVDSVASNQSTFGDVVLETGTYDYKVIALNDGVPSASSPIASVNAEDTGGNEGLTGEEHYQTKCADCHGADASGGDVGISLDTERDLPSMVAYIEANMPIGAADDCDATCADAIGVYLSSTFWDQNNEELVCESTNYGARQLKLLTRAEYQSTVEDLIGVNFNAADGLASDNVVELFVNNAQATVVTSVYDRYLTVAEDIAQWSADRDFSPALNCGGNFNQTCANQFINDFAPRVFRRALTSQEQTTYSTMANGSATSGDVKAGIQIALEAMLSSPQFLYRHEIGELNPNNNNIDSDAYELTSYEMATWLSYTFTGSTPDDTALQKAANDQLRTESQILQEAQRLLDNQGAEAVMGDFVGSWLGTDELENAPKDPNTWPGFADLIPHMEQEIRMVFANVMLDPNQTFDMLYAGDFTYVNGPLAQHYGITGVSGDQFQRVDTTDRGGILTSGAFMARWSEDIESSPIRRSVRVRRRLLCQNQPEPPANIALGREQALEENADLINDPTTTNRMKYAAITDAEECHACHREWINPLGFGMEDFDAVGNPRTVDLNGNMINAVGQLYAPEHLSDKDTFIDFTGSRGLGELLTTLPSAQSCVPQQMFRYVIGVGVDGVTDDNPEGPTLSPEERDGYACEVQSLTNTMMQQSPRAMLESMGVMDAVRYRKAWPRQ